MKRCMFVTMVALVVTFVVGGGMAYAQNVTSDLSVTAQIEFTFYAGGKEMAAGKYTFLVTPAGPVILAGPGGVRTSLPVITTLGRHDRDPDPEFVFDKIGGTFLLSEVWMPGKDGLCVLATPGPHSHGIVGGSNPRK